MLSGTEIRPVSLFVIGVPAALIIIVIVFIVNKSKGRKVSVLRETVKFIFITYLVLLVSLALFPINFFPKDVAFGITPGNVNLIPFKTIIFELGRHGSIGIHNNVGNLVLLAPLGFFVPLLFPRFRKLHRCILLGFFVSLAIEILQLLEDYFSLASYRAADIDDILLNVISAFIGFLIFSLFFKLIKTIKRAKPEND
jgi:glycopeptide antibiotics resistance protein